MKLENWAAEIAGDWIHQQAVVDEENGNEIVGPVETIAYWPFNGLHKAHIIFGRNNKMYLVWGN
jgi:hypothetical protein